jgi:hypothetical protein
MKKRNLQGFPFDLGATGLVCDSPACDWKDEAISSEDYHKYVDTPCPHCGANILTQDDFKRTEIILNFISRVNNFFAFFGLKRIKKGSKVTSGTINVHKKYKFTDLKVVKYGSKERKTGQGS